MPVGCKSTVDIITLRVTKAKGHVATVITAVRLDCYLVFQVLFLLLKQTKTFDRLQGKI